MTTLRDRLHGEITSYLADVDRDIPLPMRTDAILAIVREWMAEPAVVERAKRAQYRVSGHMGSDASMKAALASALEPGA